MSQQVGPYSVVRELGRGGMGVVYEVRHPEIPRPLALKLQLDTADAQALARFQREGELLARLNHPGVVRVHGTGTTARGYPYLVTEFIDGRPLDEVAKAGIDPDAAVRLVASLCDALAALHKAGIVHRDLKPKNVILTPEGRPILLDFGIARDTSAERMTRTGQMIGTPAYMAPEQLDNASAVDERTDVYGLGAILFFLVCARDPYVASGLPALLKKILTDRIQWPDDREVPPGLRAVVERALAKEPNDRPAAPAGLKAELEAYLRGERSQGSNRAPLLLAVGGLVLCLFAIALLLFLPREEPPPPTEPAPKASPPPKPDQAPPPEEKRTPFPAEALSRLRALKADSDPRNDLERARAYRSAVNWIRENRDRDPVRVDGILEVLSEGGEASIRANHLLKTIVPDAPARALVGGGFLDDDRIALHAVSDRNPVVYVRQLGKDLDTTVRLKAQVRNANGSPERSAVLASSIHRGQHGQIDLAFASENHRVYWFRCESPGGDFFPRTRKRENLDEQDTTAFWAVPGENRGRAVHVVAFSPTGEHLAIGGDWPVVFLLDRSGNSRRLGEGRLGNGVRDLAFSPDGKLLLTTSYRRPDETDTPQPPDADDAQLFRLSDDAPLGPIPNAAGAARVTGLFHPERRLFVLAVQPGDAPARLLLHDANTSQQTYVQAEIPNGARKGEQLPYAHFDPVDDLVASADGKRLYSASRTVQQPGMLSVWNTSNPEAPRWIRDVSLNRTPWVRLSLSPGEHWILAVGSDPRRTNSFTGAPVHLFGAGDW